jgi:hypothetical protein
MPRGRSLLQRGIGHRLAHMIHSITLADVPDTCVALLNGKRVGRTIITLAE